MRSERTDQSPSSSGLADEPQVDEIVFEAVDDPEMVDGTRITQNGGSLKESPVSPVTEAAAPEWFNRKRARAGSPAGDEQEPPVESDDETAVEWSADDPAENQGAYAPRSPADSPPPLRKRRLANAPKVIIATEPEADEPEEWQARVKRWLISCAVAGYAISLLVHLLLLIILSISMFLVQGMVGENEISTAFSESEGESLDFVEIVKPQIEAPVASLAANVPSQMQPVTKLQNSEAASLPSELLQSISEMVAQSGNAVTKGSFTAWTVPEDPKPEEDYIIVIQVALPKKIKTYSSRDLTGFVVGTDGYRTPIGHYDGSSFPKKYYGRFNLETRQLVIKIPGTYKNVEDTITIESKLLKEKQTLKIVF